MLLSVDYLVNCSEFRIIHHIKLFSIMTNYMIDLKGKETKVGTIYADWQYMRDSACSIVNWLQGEQQMFRPIELSRMSEYIHAVHVFATNNENFKRTDLEEFFITKTRINIQGDFQVLFSMLAGFEIIEPVETFETENQPTYVFSAKVRLTEDEYFELY